MNAMTQIKADESLRGSVNERALAHTIRLHCPEADEMEMAVRVAIASIRDRAGAAWARACPEAAAFLCETDRQASLAVHAPFPTSKLLRIRASLDLAMMAAWGVEQSWRD